MRSPTAAPAQITFFLHKHEYFMPARTLQFVRRRGQGSAQRIAQTLLITLAFVPNSQFVLLQKAPPHDFLKTGAIQYEKTENNKLVRTVGACCRYVVFLLCCGGVRRARDLRQ